MQTAIRDLKNQIKYYENQRNKFLEFFSTDDFKNQTLEHTENSVEFVIGHTNRIYDGCISELNKAIYVLERVGDSRRKKHMRKRRCR
jgi:hypothetical protein